VNARPRPSPVRLTLKQRRALSICEYFSARMGREVIVPGRGYWLGFWLEWSPQVSAYVELPSNPDAPDTWLADYWIECGGVEFLVDVVVGDRPNDTSAASDPWTLAADGFEPATEGSNAKITPRWQWARRSLLLSLEQAHPYAVAARLQGGLKAQCNRLLTDFAVAGEDIADICDRVDAKPYVVQCALFHLLRTGKLRIDWPGGLSMHTRFQKVAHAS